MVWRSLALALLLAAGVAEAADSLAVVKQRGSLRIGCEGTYVPFCYQEENGELVGYDVEVARAVAARIGVKAEFLPTKWDGILAALDAGRFDVIANQVTISEERKRAYAFSNPYTYSGLQLLIRKSDAATIKAPADLAGKRVGVLLGTNHEKWLLDNVPKADIRTYEEDATRNQDLLVGRIDAVLNDRLIIGPVLKRYDGQLIASGSSFAATEQAMAVKKGSPELVAAIDQALASLRSDGSLAKISEKWFSTDVSHP